MPKHWLAGDGTGDNANCIGGRATDVSQIAHSLEHKLKAAFPINEVPTELLVRWRSMESALCIAETEIEDFLTAFREALDARYATRK